MGIVVGIVLVGIVFFLFCLLISVPYKWIKNRQRKVGVRSNAQVDIADAVADGIRQARNEGK